MRTAEITLGGKKHQVAELRSRDNAAWRKKLEKPFRELVTAIETAPEIELTTAGLSGLVSSVSGLVLGSMDTVVDLVKQYAPDLKRAIDGAYDSEILEAFTEVLKLAYPFGSMLETLVSLGSRLGAMLPSSPEPNGASGTTTEE